MKFKLMFKIKSILIIITTLMLMISTSSVLFAKGKTNNTSLASIYGFNDNEEIEVIVEFKSPSLLELNINVDDLYASNYENKLLSEQKTILDIIDADPTFSYTTVINAAAIKATKQEISILEKTNGVEGVYISQTYEELNLGELNSSSISTREMMGISSSVSSEYTGDGVLVAILDSGITFKHEAFNNTKYVQNPSLTPEDISLLGFNVEDCYYNEKIPFYFDYSNSTADFTDTSGHGSHVAGIIAGYAENEDGSVKFSGIAPGAQICAMRVLNEYGGGNDSMIIAALEDAYKLGVDIINISFGRDSSFRLGGAASIDYNGIYENLENAGVVVVCSAGNLGSMADNTPRHVLDENCVDYGTLSLPAIYPGNIGVGSINSNQQYASIIKIDGQQYLYTDNQDSGPHLDFKEVFGGKSVDILYFDNYGKEEDYDGIDVKGKIIAVKRGELSFTDKCKYASEAGAIGLIVINGPTDAIGGMVIDNQSIPAILIENGIAQHFPKNNYVVSLDYGMVNIDDSAELSYFSAIGVTPDLEIGLDILGIGSKVTSVKSDTLDEYIAYSGTSMASPTIAGTYALLYQIYKDSVEYQNKSRFNITSYIEDVTQSTATLLTDDLGNLYSPRFQGAGYINFNKAVSSNAYITTPLVCLGYDKNTSGSVSVEYELVNRSNTDIKYIAKVSAITDSFTQITPINYKNHVTPKELDSSLYSYSLYVDDFLILSEDSFTLPAKEKITVKVELTLNSDTANKLSAAFPYGYFLDGFVEFYDINDLSESSIHGGYVSFVGDWLSAPAIEPLTQLEVMDWINSIGATNEELLSYFAAGHVDANYSYTKLLVGDDLNYIGYNPLCDDYIPSFTDRNAISASFSNADKVLYDSLVLQPSLLRSCKTLRYVVTNSETGEVYASDIQDYVIKDIPIGQYVHFNFTSFTFEPIYTKEDESGQITKYNIPSGTEVTISIYALLDHEDAVERLESQYTITIDYTAPKVLYDYNATTKQLTVKCSDSEYLAGIVLEEVDDYNNIKSKIDSRIYADTTPGLEYIEVFDLSSYDGNNISITVSDYASNMETFVISLTEGSVSNIESIITSDNNLNIEFIDTPYLYQDANFTLSLKEEYCVNKSFEILINGEKLSPYLIDDGVYYYNITVLKDELVITTNGVQTHTFVDTIAKEPTCTSTGTLVKSCSNCGLVHSTINLDATGHKPGEYETIKEVTCTESGLCVMKCSSCEIILDEKTTPATGHIEKTNQLPFSPVICAECGEIYGLPKTTGVLVFLIVLSSIGFISIITIPFISFVKKKHR